SRAAATSWASSEVFSTVKSSGIAASRISRLASRRASILVRPVQGKTLAPGRPLTRVYRLQQPAHLDGDLLCLIAALEEEFVRVAHLAEEVANGSERHIGGSLVIDAGDDVALLNSRLGAGRSGRNVHYFERLQPRAFCDDGDAALILFVVIFEMGIRVEDDLLMRVVENDAEPAEQGAANHACQLGIVGVSQLRPGKLRHDVRRDEMAHLKITQAKQRDVFSARQLRIVPLRRLSVRRNQLARCREFL